MSELTGPNNGETNLKMVPGMEPDEFVSGTPCFHIEDNKEYTSFCNGIKRFHLWRQHTASQKIKEFANMNPRENFYVSHHGSYTLVKRAK